MSDTENVKAKSSWTDKERLTYLFALVETANIKFDYQRTPRPAGRSVIACQRMVERLKGTLKTELEALKRSDPINTNSTTEPTSKKTAKTPATPRKRKAKTDGEENQVTPSKRGGAGGRKKKAKVETGIKEEKVVIKPEPKDEVEFEFEVDNGNENEQEIDVEVHHDDDDDNGDIDAEGEVIDEI